MKRPLYGQEQARKAETRFRRSRTLGRSLMTSPRFAVSSASVGLNTMLGCATFENNVMEGLRDWSRRPSMIRGRYFLFEISIKPGTASSICGNLGQETPNGVYRRGTQFHVAKEDS